MNLLKKLNEKARRLKAKLLALWFAYRDPRTPWYAKVWAVIVVGYAFSPIDLIPDFIPVLGYLDDAIILPIGIWIAIRLIPQEIFADSQEKAQEWLAQSKAKPKNWGAAVLIMLFWGLLLFVSLYYVIIKR